MIQVALLGKWHVHAEDYARQAERDPNLSIQLVWDEDPKCGKQWAGELGVAFESKLDKVLTNPEIDAVIVNTPTSIHKEIIIEAAKNDKHIFTEKVLASSVKDCEEIFSNVASSNVQLMVSLPRLTEPYYLYAQHAVDQGLLGQLTMVRCRLAHNGAVPYDGQSRGWLPERFFNKEQTGGGAFIDLGAHPIYLTNRLAGPATSVIAKLQSAFTDQVDDHSVALIEYASGALGTIETGFVSHGSPFQLELYGTEGTILIEENHIRINSRHFEEEGWVIPENIPDSLPMPMEQWINAIQNGTTPAITNEDLRNLTLLNEAVALSDQRNSKVWLNEIVD